MAISAIVLALVGVALVCALAVRTYSGPKAPSMAPHEGPLFLLVSTTFHSRFKPVLHSFRYPVLYVGVDLDASGFYNSIFSFDAHKKRVLSLRTLDYLGDSYKGSIKQRLWSHLENHGIPTSGLGKAFLITTPRLLGYSFNPVSFHYVYDRADVLRVIVLEVNNTFGEKHIYVLQEDSRQNVVRKGYTNSHIFPRKFHVSPFNDRSGSYRLQCRDPFIELLPSVKMHLTLLEENGSKKLTAQVESRIPAIDLNNTLATFIALLRYGTAVFLTVPRIIYQAYFLHYCKKMDVFVRPEPYEELGAIGRQAASSQDLYFQQILFRYLRDFLDQRPDHPTIIFDILPASPAHRAITIPSPSKAEPVRVTVVTYAYFTSLFTSSSALSSLWTDSIAQPSPLFYTSSIRDYLSFFPMKKTSHNTFLESRRLAWRGDGSDVILDIEYNGTVLHPSAGCHTTNTLDKYVIHTGNKSERTIYHYQILSALFQFYFGNRIFGLLARFDGGPAGSPGGEWQRVKARMLSIQKESDHRSSS